jgi:hypothetical protein
MLAGVIVGALGTILGLMLVGGFYEYDWNPAARFPQGGAFCDKDDQVRIVTWGWERVPNQPDPCYVRRPRLRLR